MNISDLIPILLFTTSTALTPGPNNFMLLNAGLHQGVRKSLGLYFGICLGFPIMVLIVALGFGEIFVRYPLIKEVLKVLGALYMLYLAWQILISEGKPGSGRGIKSFGFFKAFLFQWINPKAWLMAIGVISIFTLMANPFSNALAISGIFFLVCLPCLGLWLMGGAALQKILKEDWHRKLFNSVMALGLVASVVMIFLD